MKTSPHVRAQNTARYHANKEHYAPVRKRWAVTHRDEMLAYSRNRRVDFTAWIDGLKADQPCMDCGGSFDPGVMEYDHVRGSKRYNISRMANHKRERVLQEIAKCDLTCCACHRVRTAYRRPASTTPRLVAFKKRIDILKAEPCVDCRSTFAPEAMDFDHLGEEIKVAQISNMWHWAWAKVEVELAKCALRCANCHRLKTLGLDLRRAA